MHVSVGELQRTRGRQSLRGQGWGFVKGEWGSSGAEGCTRDREGSKAAGLLRPGSWRGAGVHAHEAQQQAGWWALSPSPMMGNAAFGCDTVTPSGYARSISKVRKALWPRVGEIRGWDQVEYSADQDTFFSEQTILWKRYMMILLVDFFRGIIHRYLLINAYRYSCFRKVQVFLFLQWLPLKWGMG